jgi:hypothetical protein
MRLIDADAMNAELFYKQVGGKDSLITAESAFEMINAQPTAYDQNKVVEQLEMKIDNAEFDELLTSNEKDAYVDAYRRAIEIVKGGGVDGN